MAMKRAYGARRREYELIFQQENTDYLFIAIPLLNLLLTA